MIYFNPPIDETPNCKMLWNVIRSGNGDNDRGRNFNAQEVTLTDDMKNYDYIIIFCIATRSTWALHTPLIIPKAMIDTITANNQFLGMLQAQLDAGVVSYMRPVQSRVDTKKLYFGTGRTLDTVGGNEIGKVNEGTGGQTSGYYCIPQFVYGVKFQ